MPNPDDINNQHEFWDRVAGEKTFTIPVDVDLLRRHLPADARILDYGCGYGRVSAELARSGFTNIVGVDSAPAMIRRAKEENPQITFEMLPPGGLQAPPASFDAILLVAVLTCIPESDAQHRLVKTLSDVLRPGGLFCVSDFILQDDERNRKRYAGFADEFGTYGVFRLDEGAVVRHHDPGYLDELLRSFGTIQRSFPEVITMNGHRAMSFHWVGRKRFEP
jgi:SAM-dependent methyltransferase